MKKPIIGVGKEMIKLKDLKDKVEFEYQHTLKRWRELQQDFDFQRQTFHNIHLSTTIDNMSIIVKRLQFLSYLLEKWDDN